jgi:hypothetical protein
MVRMWDQPVKNMGELTEENANKLRDIHADIAAQRARRPGGYETRCGNCIYWEYDEQTYRDRRNDEDYEGYCQRHAPVGVPGWVRSMGELLGLATWAIEEMAHVKHSKLIDYECGIDSTAQWPMTSACHWCGAFQARQGQ